MPWVTARERGSAMGGCTPRTCRGRLVGARPPPVEAMARAPYAPGPEGCMDLRLLRRSWRLALVAAALLGWGCGDDADDHDHDHDHDAAAEADGGGADAAPAFTTLLTSSWSIPALSEIYQCERLTVDRDVYISGFHATTPLGSHHSVLTVGPPDGPDGTSVCGAGTNRPAMIFGAGVDTNAIMMPPGVAMKVPAGQQ